jgi:hypothetical protein
MNRRRPVPASWREQHHHLRVTTKAWGYGIRRASRSRGRCACGAQWPDSPNANNLSASDVRTRWLDHVEDAYYGNEKP